MAHKLVDAVVLKDLLTDFYKELNGDENSKWAVKLCIDCIDWLEDSNDKNRTKEE